VRAWQRPHCSEIWLAAPLPTAAALLVQLLLSLLLLRLLLLPLLLLLLLLLLPYQVK
jgi:hypothetical protein